MKKRDVILEIQSMLPALRIGGGWQCAKTIYEFGHGLTAIDQTTKAIGRGQKITREKAVAIIEEAMKRIAVADEGESGP